MATRVHVWPLGDKWVVSEFTDFEAFLNDWVMFGFRVAVYNLWYLLTRRT